MSQQEFMVSWERYAVLEIINGSQTLQDRCQRNTCQNFLLVWQWEVRGVKNNREFWPDELEDEYAFNKMRGGNVYQTGEVDECVNQEFPSGYIKVRTPLNCLDDCHAESWMCDI